MIPHRTTGQQNDQFKRIFGVGTHSFVNPFTGFDVIAFDEFVKTPDGVSTRDHVLTTYGADAVRLVEVLLKA